MAQVSELSDKVARELEGLHTRAAATEAQVAAVDVGLQGCGRDNGALAQRLDGMHSQLKELAALMLHALPLPESMSVVPELRGARRALQLQYFCFSSRAGTCLYPRGLRAFTVQTRQYASWVKTMLLVGQVAACAAVVPVQGVSGAVSLVQSMYALWQQLHVDSEEDINRFHSLLSGGSAAGATSAAAAAALLTSAEHDAMLSPLRNCAFFDVFALDTERGGWCCSMCSPEAVQQLVAGGAPPAAAEKFIFDTPVVKSSPLATALRAVQRVGWRSAPEAAPTFLPMELSIKHLPPSQHQPPWWRFPGVAATVGAAAGYWSLELRVTKAATGGAARGTAKSLPLLSIRALEVTELPAGGIAGTGAGAAAVAVVAAAGGGARAQLRLMALDCSATHADGPVQPSDVWRCAAHVLAVYAEVQRAQRMQLLSVG